MDIRIFYKYLEIVLYFLSFLSLAIINLTFMDVQRFHFSKFLNEKRNVIENESFKVFHVKNNSTVQVYIPYKMMIEKRIANACCPEPSGNGFFPPGCAIAG